MKSKCRAWRFSRRSRRAASTWPSAPTARWPRSSGGTSPNSSGGNFEVPPGGIGDGFDLSDLLPPTALAFQQYDGGELTPRSNADPLFEDFYVRLSEEGLDDANPDNDGFEDTTNAKMITGNFGATDPNGDPLTYSLGVPDPVINAGIKSGGVDVVWDLVSPTLLEGKVGGKVVIRITITNASAGDYQIELIGPFDHANAGGRGQTRDRHPGDGRRSVRRLGDSQHDCRRRGRQSVAERPPTRQQRRPGRDDGGFSGRLRLAGIEVTSARSDPRIHVELRRGRSRCRRRHRLCHHCFQPDSGLQTAIGDFPITLEQTSPTTITGTYNGGTQTAFTVEINAGGTLTVTQYQPLEHTIDGFTAAAHDDALTLSGKITASVTITDFDGDSVGGFAQIGGSIIFEDDGPSVSGQVTALTVDEDDIDSDFSDGSSPSDGIVDGSDSVNTPFGLAATVTGSLAGLVNFGADGAAAAGGFGFAPTAATEMTALGLTSQGVALSYTIVGDTLIAYVENGGVGYNAATDRTVFDLSVNAASGNFTFHQYDQLDHIAPPAGTADENTALIGTGGSISAIDFGGVIRATDSDGDYRRPRRQVHHNDQG